VPETPPVEVQIEDGDLESEPERIQASDGRVRLQVRSDRFVIVEVEDPELSWPVLAGQETLIEFDTRSTKSYEVELRRRRGALVLRLDD
jgi:hypothetical protein